MKMSPFPYSGHWAAPLLRISLCLGFSLAFLVKGEEKQNGKDAKTPEPGKSGESSVQMPPSKPVGDPIMQEVRKKQNDVRELLQKKEFDKLDEMTTRYRKERTSYKHGYPKLAVVYEGLEPLRTLPTEEWLKQKALYEAWAAARPSSLTARVGMGVFLVRYAWQARGSGYANTVEDKNWEKFRERLAEAKKVLETARYEFAEKDPYLFCLLMDVALGLGEGKEVADKLLEDGLAIDPTFWLLDTRRVFGLLPRWGGAEGEWQTFAMDAAARPGGLGDEIYYRIVRHVGIYEKGAYKDKHISWPKFKDGIAAVRKKYPDALDILCAATGYAMRAGDRAAAKEYFEALNGRYIPQMWSSAQYYEDHRKWAYLPGHPLPVPGRPAAAGQASDGKPDTGGQAPEAERDSGGAN